MNAPRVRTAISRLAPQLVRRKWQARVIRRESIRNAHRPVEDVFTEIYMSNTWGGATGDFNSGSGSTTEAVVRPYVDALRTFASERHLKDATWVDLGCGDFRVGSQVAAFVDRYIGCDVVAPLVQRNSELFADDHIQFRHLDMTANTDLPDGEVAMIRQAFQHLSNEQISRALSRLRGYQYVIITEHWPAEPLVAPNLDKVQGGSIRAHVGSAVSLTDPPFNIPADQMEVLLCVQAPALVAGEAPGTIRTWLWTPLKGEAHGARLTPP